MRHVFSPERPQGPHGRLLVDGVPRQPRQGTELHRHGPHAGGARHGGLPGGHAAPEVHRAGEKTQFSDEARLGNYRNFF